METDTGNSLFYPVFKMIIGVLCLVLAIEYGYAYCVYQSASFGIIYIGDMVTWLLAGFILFTEGLYVYLKILRSKTFEFESNNEKSYVELHRD